jgi:hypothetical protein
MAWRASGAASPRMKSCAPLVRWTSSRVSRTMAEGDNRPRAAAAACPRAGAIGIGGRRRQAAGLVEAGREQRSKMTSTAGTALRGSEAHRQTRPRVDGLKRRVFPRHRTGDVEERQVGRQRGGHGLGLASRHRSPGPGRAALATAALAGRGSMSSGGCGFMSGTMAAGCTSFDSAELLVTVRFLRWGPGAVRGPKTTS